MTLKAKPRVGFVMEQTLGHVTHHRNLERFLERRNDLEPVVIPVLFEADDLWERLPVVRTNWALRASLRARRAIHAACQRAPMDALFMHTQTTALFALDTMRKVPTIVSLDATPLNYDTMAEAYNHRPDGKGWLASGKHRWHRAAFRGAAHLVTWSEWAKRSLVEDYDIGSNRVTVIPPGVDLDQWGDIRSDMRPVETDATDSKLRLLFVGADFTRKGGDLLIEAFRKQLFQHCRLDIVTRDRSVVEMCAQLVGVQVHTDLSPNSEQLRRLFGSADIFVFPTRADCLPIAVIEAMAVGLPIVATDVGALNEEVVNGENGLVAPPNSVQGVIDAVERLRCAPARRAAMGACSRERASRYFDARCNYNALIDLIVSVA